MSLKLRDALRRYGEGVLKVIAAVWRIVGPRDLQTYGGLALVGVGVHEIYPPAAWTVVGLVLLYIGTLHGALASRLERGGE